MSVEKRGGKWYIRGKIKRDDGSYISFNRLARGCTGKKQAEEYERKFRKQFQDIQVSSMYLTFKEAADEYIQSLNGVKQSTVRSYTDMANKLCETFGDKKINLITKDKLQKYISELESIYASETVAGYYYVLRSIFDYCVNNDHLKSNPMSKVHRKVNVEQIKHDMNFWEPSEFNVFLSVIKEKEHRSFFIFLYWMGVRKAEACALQWKDVDFDTNTVRIYKNITYKVRNKPWMITTPKTSNSERNITMFDVVRESLLDWKQECSKMYGFCEDCFVWGFYKPLSDNTPGRWKDKYVDLANSKGLELKRIRLHDFRHSHASYLINNMGKYDFTDFDIAKRLGHTVDMLHRTYAHQFKGMDKRIIEQIQNDTRTPELTHQQSKTTPYDELKQLKELYDMGILTDEEYACGKPLVLFFARKDAL